MGCASSKQDTNDNNSNIFKVFNVDDRGNSINEGQLEIAGMDLMLHQRGKDSITWPLKCLRRYGFDQDLFSFESGRRCPTGPGIYAFRCRHAETLFNILQECIQQAGDGSEPSPSPSAPSSGILLNTMNSSQPSSFSELRAASPMTIHNGYSPTGQGARTLPANFSQHNGHLRVSRDHSYINGNLNKPSSQSSPRLRNVVSSNTAQESRNEYLNTLPSAGIMYTNVNPDGIAFKMDSNGNDQKILNYAELDLPKSLENLNEIGLDSKCQEPDTFNATDMSHGKTKAATTASAIRSPRKGQPTYINVGAEAKKTEFRETTNARCTTPKGLHGSSSSNIELPGYANLDMLPGPVNGIRRDLHQCASSSVRQVNYIQLDLDKDDNQKGYPTVPPSPLSLTLPESPNRRTEMYATIDFNKTTALSNSTRTPCTEENGIRKTRHDSTANDLYNT